MARPREQLQRSLPDEPYQSSARAIDHALGGAEQKWLKIEVTCSRIHENGCASCSDSPTRRTLPKVVASWFPNASCSDSPRPRRLCLSPAREPRASSSRRRQRARTVGQRTRARALGRTPGDSAFPRRRLGARAYTLVAAMNPHGTRHPETHRVLDTAA